MTLAQVKQSLNIVALDLSRSMDEAGKPTVWQRYWNNKERFGVVVHDDVVKYIKEHPDTTKLALKYEQKATKTGDQQGLVYDSYILIKADSIVESL